LFDDLARKNIYEQVALTRTQKYIEKNKHNHNTLQIDNSVDPGKLCNCKAQSPQYTCELVASLP
jgi:hypothetical protein